MEDIIYEITKHIRFDTKIIVKLTNKRLFQYIKIHIFPKNHIRLNNERIALFPDLKELEIWNENILPINYQHLKLVSLSIWNMFSYIKNNNFDYIDLFKNTLKKIYLYSLNDDFDYTVFKELDLIYISIDRYDENEIFYDSIKHMKLNNCYINGSRNNNSLNFTNRYLKSIIKYLDLNISNNDTFDIICSFSQLKSLRLSFVKDIDILDKIMNLSKLKLHKLAIYISNDEQFNNIILLLQQMTLYELFIGYSGDLKIPIYVILKSDIHIYHTYCNDGNYTDSERQILLDFNVHLKEVD